MSEHGQWVYPAERATRARSRLQESTQLEDPRMIAINVQEAIAEAVLAVAGELALLRETIAEAGPR